jgi:hypothetical protein
LELKAEGNEEYYSDTQGEYYLIKTPTFSPKTPSDKWDTFKKEVKEMIYKEAGLSNFSSDKIPKDWKKILDAEIDRILKERSYKIKTESGKDIYV